MHMGRLARHSWKKKWNRSMRKHSRNRHSQKQKLINAAERVKRSGGSPASERTGCHSTYSRSSSITPCSTSSERGTAWGDCPDCSAYLSADTSATGFDHCPRRLVRLHSHLQNHVCISRKDLLARKDLLVRKAPEVLQYLHMAVLCRHHEWG